ncbi:MAG: glycosyltransferase family 2 protein [Candidatus Micrarchaeota archaeon]
MKGKKTVAVIPAYNEEKRLGEVLKELKQYVDEIVVSDDGSSDRTAEIARKAGAKVISSPVNMGVGHATRLGCDYAITKRMAEVIVLIDADGQHAPSDIPKLLEKIDGSCEFVFTSRFKEKKEMPVIKTLGNSFLTFSTNLLSGISITDSQSGFRAMTKEAYEKLDLRTDGYEICSEFAIEVGRKRIKYREVQIRAVYDDWTKIKGTDVTTGMKIFARSLWMRLIR